MISKKARKRKKVISFLMRLVTLIEPGSLTHFQIKLIRQLVLIASYRRSGVKNTIFEKIKFDQLDLYSIKPKKLSDTKNLGHLGSREIHDFPPSNRE